MASAAATLAVAGAALRLANPCGISGVAEPVAQQDRRGFGSLDLRRGVGSRH